MKLTPTWIQNFETNLQTLISGQAERIVKDLIWDQIMDVKTSVTGRELYFFLIESMNLSREDNGGNKRFEDIAAKYFEIVNESSGAGLVLTKNEIEDNMMAKSQIPALDYAATWAKKMGANAARWPQDLMFELLAAGESTVCWDGQFFFDVDHPIDPTATGGPVYANLFTGAAIPGVSPGALPIGPAVTLDVATANFAKALAYVESMVGPDGKPRHLRVKAALAGKVLKTRLNQILDTKFLTTSALENVVSRDGIQPLSAPEIAVSDESYILVCEFIPGEGGGLIFQNREDYALTTYGPMTDADLSRSKEFEWHYDGRNAGAYGHPYLLIKVKAT